MCGTCGCHESDSANQNSGRRHITLNESILNKNQHIADHNRDFFQEHNLPVVNIMSSPGSGKTSLIEKTISLLSPKINLRVLVGDQQTNHDAERIKRAGGEAKQITTHSACHIDASMIRAERTSMESIPDLLFIENVGNLVCPASFDLGESFKVVLLSVTEGEDKPVKYPTMFHKADLVIFTKTDLVPYLNWDEKLCRQYLERVNPSCKVIKTSTVSEEGLSDWVDFLTTLVPQNRLQA